MWQNNPDKLSLRKVPTDLHVGLISHTDVDPELFFKLICRKFELRHDSLDKGDMIREANPTFMAPQPPGRIIKHHALTQPGDQTIGT